MLFWALERNVGRTELTIKVKDNKIILKKKKKKTWIKLNTSQTFIKFQQIIPKNNKTPLSPM